MSQFEDATIKNMQGGLESSFPKSGKMCTIYMDDWNDTSQGRTVPVITKVFHSATPQGFSEIYLHEAAARASPGVTKVYQPGLERGRLLLRMEYCEKGSLACEIEQRKRDNQPFNSQLVMVTMINMLRTLRDLHAVNIAHRAVSTENFLLTADFSIKLTDFGAAKLIERGKELDSHTELPGNSESGRAVLNPFAEDVFALGKVVYEMALLRPCRYDTQTPSDLLRADLNSKLRKYSLSAIAEPLAQMLCPLSEDRITAAEALMQLERLPSLSEDTPVMYLTDFTGTTGDSSLDPQHPTSK